MEQAAIYLHLAVFGGCHLKEIVSVLNRHQAICLPVHHQYRIGKFLACLLEPLQSIADRITQSGSKGLLIVWIFAIPVHDFRN